MKEETKEQIIVGIGALFFGILLMFIISLLTSDLVLDSKIGLLLLIILVLFMLYTIFDSIRQKRIFLHYVAEDFYFKNNPIAFVLIALFYLFLGVSVILLALYLLF